MIFSAKPLMAAVATGWVALFFGAIPVQAATDRGAPPVQSREVAATNSYITQHDGRCEVGEFCLYYNSSSYGYGSSIDIYGSDSSLFDNRFVVPNRAGYGQVVANNAAAFWNRSPFCVSVYTLVGRKGIRGYIPPGRYGDFSANYKNNVESINVYELVDGHC